LLAGWGALLSSDAGVPAVIRLIDDYDAQGSQIAKPFATISHSVARLELDRYLIVCDPQADPFGHIMIRTCYRIDSSAWDRIRNQP
jgi:hypothetical protein